MMILRGIDQDPNFFVNCDFWAINLQAVLILTELNCALVELFFILRMWRFAEKKRLAIFAFVPYIFSTGFNFRYIKGMIEIPCYPEMSVNSIWLILAYSLKILSDGIIAGTMTWLLYNRSRGVRQDGGMIRVVRELMYWTLSTGIILWVSTIVHVLTYTLLADSLISVGIFLTRSRIYVIAMLAVINDRRRVREVIQQPESISLRITALKAPAPSQFWSSMGPRSQVKSDATGIQRCLVRRDLSPERE